MLDKILKTIQRYQMFEPGERVVVAVSGGPDSMALLHVLNRLNHELCLEICVAHLDHRVRPHSGRDLAFVRQTARSRGLPFYGGVLDRRRIKKGGSSEDLLRDLRYDFLSGIAKKFRTKKIVLGHTQDDQAETVLMRILRGSGLYGLSAILPKRALDSLNIVRPLIEVPRKEIMRYLKINKIRYRLDATNLSEKFMRNKVRIKLLPLLEKEYNPNIKEVLSHFALLVGADYNYLECEADGFLKRNLKYIDHNMLIDLEALKKLDISQRRLVLRRALGSLRGDLRKLTFQHWQEMEDLLFFRPYEAQVHLPKDITVSKTKGWLNIFKR